MPEIPDLNMYAHNLQKQLKGEKVADLEIYVEGKVRREKEEVGKDEVLKAIKGKELQKIERDGKMLYFSFSGAPKVLGFHLMLHGKFYITTEPQDQENRIFAIKFADGRYLVQTDWQYAAHVMLEPVIPIVPDVMSPEFTEEYFLAKMDKHPRMGAKSFITDQKIMRGIGNAYSDEILWTARVSPFAKVGNIPPEYRTDLYHSIRKVINDGQETLKKREPDMINSIIRDFLGVHNSRRTESPTGHKILRHKAGASNTYYTEEQSTFDN
jgi:formamidopyrimidine-DNA glycosylase